MDEERVTQIGEASMLPDGALGRHQGSFRREAECHRRNLDRLSKQGGIIGARPQVSLKELAKANGLPV